MQAQVIAYCRIVKAREGEWEVYMRPNRIGIMIQVAYGLTFDAAVELKDKVNYILQEYHGKIYDKDKEPTTPTTRNPSIPEEQPDPHVE